MQYREKIFDLFYFTSFFARLFLNFLACCVMQCDYLYIAIKTYFCCALEYSSNCSIKSTPFLERTSLIFKKYSVVVNCKYFLSLSVSSAISPAVNSERCNPGTKINILNHETYRYFCHSNYKFPKFQKKCNLGDHPHCLPEMLKIILFKKNSEWSGLKGAYG